MASTAEAVAIIPIAGPPILTRKLPKNKVGRPRFSMLFGTVINSPQLKRGDSASSATSAYTTASEATSASTSVLESVESAATSPTITPAVDSETCPPLEEADSTPTPPAADQVPEICPTCKARTLSSHSVPVLQMKSTTPSTSPKPQAAAPLSPTPPETEIDKITPVTSPTSTTASPEHGNGHGPEINDKATKKHPRPKLQRNLSSLWKLLDPPDLRNKTGVLHNLVEQDVMAEKHQRKGQGSHARNKESVDSITLNETLAHKAYRR
ncbi:uncharacterized protein MYCFIDRAFT_77595 [Pseudocercospora fijiensis CIRAD86]|uniref:Uncharacterized protein n=1 Tax=Pseudocercospora fijiensis (strain CIRAD86) TaxID=383855 RepID=M3AC19_PSEFD|nr:uncharacterized protein MYCFIDRAFT_77595 [Pseudocercospora fijiensis CIRAD86]EME82111.1 hypothetical protein MYCFIDRAFT_77595 [Pseudocercospora fijiensis CIRAD86]